MLGHVVVFDRQRARLLFAAAPATATRHCGSGHAPPRWSWTLAKRAAHFSLVKSELDAYSIDDLQRDGREPWTGVRNYIARNLP